MNEKLKPCPFCGSEDVSVWATTNEVLDILPEGVDDYDASVEYPESVMFEIGCMGCDFCTGKFFRPAHVIDKWNRRLSNPPPESATRELIDAAKRYKKLRDLAQRAEKEI